MAEQREEDLELAPAEAGWTFRAEMATTNFLMGYWKHLVAVLVVVLLSVLFYEQYQTYVLRTQRGVAAEIAQVEESLPTVLIDIPRALQMGDPEIDPSDVAQAAKQMEAVAQAATGPAAVEAWMKAAELYRLAEQPDAQRAALEQAATDGEGVLHFAAESALANLDLAEGKGDEGVARLKALIQQYDGFLAQQATLDLGLALEHLGRSDEAKQTYADFLQRWPDSARAEEVRRRAGQVGAAG